MPELPEVETMRRGITAAIGSTVRDVHRLPCEKKPIRIRPRIDAMRRRIAGRKVQQVSRIGKRVVLNVDGGAGLVFEPRMTGLVLITDPPSIEHLRFRVALERGPISEILYWDRRGLGSVQLLTAAELQTLASVSLGRDALQLQPQELRERLANSRRPVKVALLDQQRVAGIGNLYASEILHVARIHPARSCHRISGPQWSRIHAAIGEVLTAAILHEGSTLSDGTYRNALNNPGGYQNHHRVYNREGEPCPDCKDGVVRRIVQAQRSTFYCPRCQRR